MASQNNSGRQYDKVHAITIVAAVALLANRLIAFDGGYATSAGAAKDMQGATETDIAQGEAGTLITDYSALVEASEPITFGAFIKPAADGTGRLAVGTATDNCGRALGAAGGAGELVETQLTLHRHT